MTVIFLGSLWGFIEATLGGFLHMIHFPLTGSILGPVGFALLFMASRRGVKTQGLMTITFIAASFKFFDVFLFNLAPVRPEILNPAQAIVMQGLAFSLFANLLQRGTFRSKVQASVSMTLISATLFNFISYFAVSNVAPALRDSMTTLGVNLPFACVATILLFELTSKTSDRMAEELTLYRASYGLKAAASLALATAAIFAQKWLA